MPRGGPPTYTYTLPAVYLAVPGTTILATQHNSPLEDIAGVLNGAWPTNLGGTGGTSLITSWDSLNSRGDAIPTAATLDLDAATGANAHLTGTTTVTSISLSNGRVRELVSDGTFLITASASLVVNGNVAGSYQVAEGSVLLVIGGSAGVVYVNASGGSGTLFGYTTTVTAAGTTTLTASSSYQQFFTGTTTQTVVLPVTSTLALGQSFRIVNNSTGIVTVTSSGADAVVAMNGGTVAIVTCILLSGTTAASWSITYIPVTANANSNTITTTDPSSGFTALLATNTDAGAAAGPVIDLYRNSASPTAADFIGSVTFNGQNSTPAKKTYASIGSRIDDATAASEDATLILATMKAGTLTNYLTLGANAAGTATANAVGLPLGQLSFPATQNDSTNVNTLDDYEEGTWTPDLTFGGGATGLTYSSRTGVYTKIGNLVFAALNIALSAKGSSTGVAIISGLPFTVQGVAPSVVFSNYSGMAGLTTFVGVASVTTVVLQNTGAAACAQLTQANFTNTSYFNCGFCFVTA